MRSLAKYIFAREKAKNDYGSAPCAELPFILKLASEISGLANIALDLPEYADIIGRYGDRSCPNFSVLFYILSEREDRALTSMIDFFADSLRAVIT